MSDQLTVLCIGDLHFRVDNCLQTEDFESKIFPKITELRPDIIVVMGDVLDRHEILHINPHRRITSFLHRLMDYAPVYLLIGNHDRPNNSTFCVDNAHGLSALHYWGERMTVVDKVLLKTINGMKFIFAPYVPPGMFNQALRTLLPENTNTENDEDIADLLKDVRCLYVHQEVRNCRMGAVISQVGDIWPTNYPLMISGHIHDYLELSQNMIYTGSAMQHASHESSNKTLSLLTFKSDKSWSHERIDLHLIKKKIVYLSCSEVLTYIPPENQITKLVVSGTSDELKTLAKVAKIRELVKQGIKISYRHLDAEAPKPTSETVDDADGVVPLPPKQPRFLERLNETLKEDTRSMQWFEKLFGKLDLTPTLS